MKKVVKCRITEQPKSLFDPMPIVYVVFEGEETETKLFSYYPDEISFSEKELIGLTEDECRRLYTEKDKKFLLS